MLPLTTRAMREVLPQLRQADEAHSEYLFLHPHEGARHVSEFLAAAHRIDDLVLSRTRWASRLDLRQAIERQMARRPRHALVQSPAVPGPDGICVDRIDRCDTFADQRAILERWAARLDHCALRVDPSWASSQGRP